MPRNSAGTFSLPASVNPVVAGTQISPNWANPTLADVATELTDSLSRSGKGGMTAPMRTADGTVAAPAHSFTSETGSGWFRHAAGELRQSILGVYRLALTATGLTVNGKMTSTGADVTGTLAVIDDGGTSKKVTVDAPTGLAADYALTLPTALPGSTLPVTMTSAGALATSQLVNAQQNFGTPSAATDVVIKSYLGEGSGALSTATNWASVPPVTPTYSVVSGHATLSGSFTCSDSAAAEGDPIGTIPVGARPAALARFAAACMISGGTVDSSCVVEVTTGGSINLRGFNPVAGDTIYVNCATYKVA